MTITPFSSKISLKRRPSDDFDYHEEPAKKKSRTQTDIVQQLVWIAVSSNHFDIAQNVVWMNEHDFAHMFSLPPKRTPDPIQPRYLQIANRVYQVAISQSLNKGVIGISPDQFQEIKEARANFLCDGGDMVQISCFSPLLEHINALQSVMFEIENDDDFGFFSGIKTFDLAELREACHIALEGKYAVPGQSFNIDHRIGRFKLTVKEMESTQEVVRLANVDSRAVDPFGRILRSTVMDFEILSSKHISIVNRKSFDKNSCFTFTVSLLSYIDEEKNESIPMPLKIEQTKFSADVRKLLAGQNLILGDKKIFWHEGLKMQLTCDKVSDDEIPTQPDMDDDQEPEIASLIEFIIPMLTAHRGGGSSRSRRSPYDQSYSFQENSNLLFKGSSEIVFTTGKEEIAKQMDFEIVSISERESFSGETPHWLDVADLVKAIKALPHKPVKGQKFHLKIPHAKVVAKMKKAKAVLPLEKKKTKGWKRQWSVNKDTEINLSLPQQFNWKLVDNPSPVKLDKVHLKITPKVKHVITIPEKELYEAARKAMKNGIFISQIFNADVKGHKIEFKVTDLDYPDKITKKFKHGILGQVLPATEIKLSNEGQTLAITDKLISKNPITLLEEMGFGGLTKEGKEAIRLLVKERRSRIKKPLQAVGALPTKGCLLYGPPGNGKTLFARCLGSILGCDKDHIKMLSCTEVLSKWVGASEEMIRGLFAPALEAAEKHKNDSEVFLLVFDELDAILGKRKEDSKSWEIAMVNEFLAQMDGLKVFHNIIVVGLTNRFKSLDEAALRPGRFELQVELNAPDESGRKQIIEIHMKDLKKGNMIGKDVDFDLLAKKTDKFSGAELRYLVAITAKRVILDLDDKTPDEVEELDMSKIVLTMNDFEQTILAIRKADKNELAEAVQRMFL